MQHFVKNNVKIGMSIRSINFELYYTEIILSGNFFNRYILCIIQGAPLIGYTFRGLITRSASALSKFLFHITK